MASNSINVNVDTSEVVAKLEKLKNRVNSSSQSGQGLFAIMYNGGKQMESYAKRYRTWTDRTGDARRRLSGGAAWEGRNRIVAYVSHGVHYGIYLEMSHQRKYAILERSVKDNAKNILDGVGSMLDNL